MFECGCKGQIHANRGHLTVLFSRQNAFGLRLLKETRWLMVRSLTIHTSALAHQSEPC